MEVIIHNDMIELADCDFSPQHTFLCGQCFRWNICPDGAFEGVAFGKYAKISKQASSVFISCDVEHFNDIWYNYLDLNRDYSQYDALFGKNDFMRQAIDFGRGLHILAQEPWEALVSFLISQCNNIPRIQSITERLCSLFGEKIIVNGKTFFTFPTAEILAQVSLEDLSPLRAGYRAAYILNAAKSVASGEIDLNALKTQDTQAARAEIMKLHGVGRKVADCFLLFGLSKMDAFPVDTWMKKAAPLYGDGLDISCFGECAGIAQQYIFYYARETGRATNK